jgi:hypothetical protein
MLRYYLQRLKKSNSDEGQKINTTGPQAAGSVNCSLHVQEMNKLVFQVKFTLIQILISTGYYVRPTRTILTLKARNTRENNSINSYRK